MRLNIKGVSLIEIVVVIVVGLTLGFLLSLMWKSSRMRERDAIRIDNVNMLHNALVEYLKDNKKMPENAREDSLACGVEGLFMKELFFKEYIKELLTDQKFYYCYYDYGPGNDMGAVVGIKVEAASVLPGCVISKKPIWCDDKNYYCICQPYNLR